MSPTGGRRERGLVTVGLLSVALLCLVVAAYLYASALLMENDCSLVEDRICAAAARRVWSAGGLAAAFVAITGVVGASFALRAGRTRRS